MTTREQVEAEAAELYPMPAPSRAVHVRAKTISAEQVEAAAEVLAEVTGEPRAGRFERTMTRAALTAAGLIVEDDR